MGKKFNSILACTGKNIAQWGEGGDPPLLISTDEASLGALGPLVGPQYKRDLDVLE